MTEEARVFTYEELKEALEVMVERGIEPSPIVVSQERFNRINEYWLRTGKFSLIPELETDADQR